jgi:hypothetical protein
MHTRANRADRRFHLPRAWPLVAAALLMQGCVATMPTVGGGTASAGGAAGGATAEGQKKELERCDESLGTMAMEEDQRAPWYAQLRGYQLGSTIPVLRLMIQQSNCFVIVERGGGLNDMMSERQMMRGEEGRAGSNMGGGQMVRRRDAALDPVLRQDRRRRWWLGRLPAGRAGHRGRRRRQRRRQ